MYPIEVDRKYGFENDSMASLTCFLNPVLRTVGRRYRVGMLILPGGGYSTIQEREAWPVAARYMGYGMQCFVLRYTTDGPERYLEALRELCESIVLIRENCDRWDIDPSRVVVCGFSAGGHLAASLGCYSDQLSKWVNFNVRPNGLLLGYPVITAGAYAHRESIENCLNEGKNIGRNCLSLEKHVGGGSMPPVFLWASADDSEVQIQNSLLFAAALADKGVFFECHIFHSGDHGGALGDEHTARIESQINERYARWFSLSLGWLQEVL